MSCSQKLTKSSRLTSKRVSKNKPGKKRAGRVKNKGNEKAERRKKLKAWSALIRSRDGQCVVCGSNQYLQAHHLLSKTQYKELALDLDCGVTLCSGCHRFRKHSAHQNGIWFSRWLEQNRNAQWSWAINKA
jgi:5-methylcytosine-specific restriction endonuclease McrA